jgi:hypothetical protein
MFRMLTWTSGTFELEPPDEKSVLEEIQESTEGLLMEGMRQLDEMNRISHDLLPRDAALGLPSPLVAPLKDLQPPELDALQLVLNHVTVQAILDRSPRTDLETAESILKLMQKEYLVARK